LLFWSNLPFCVAGGCCLLFPNLVMLFYPVTRGSVVLQASGISYPDAIRWAVVLFVVFSSLPVFVFFASWFTVRFV
jgi:hypothetical protein